MILDLEDLPFDQKQETEESQKLQAMHQADSATLAAHVVLYKSLGLFKKSAIACMSELHRRRSLGEDFDFETFIDSELSKLPKVQPLDFNLVRGLMDLKQIANFMSKDAK